MPIRAKYSGENVASIKNHIIHIKKVNHGIGRQNVDNFRKPRITPLSLRGFLLVN
jgi:hypothetical protein